MVLHDNRSINSALLGFYAKAKTSYDCYGVMSQSTLPESEAINDTLSNLKNQGVRLRQITEITKDNMSYCKMLMKIAELRHLDGVKGKIELSDTEIIITTTPENEESHQTAQVIHSNVKQLVEQQQSLFEIVWKKAIPAEQKIRGIEDEIEPPETKVLENPEEILNHMRHVLKNASKRLICSSSGGMHLAYNNFFDQYKKIIDKYRRGEGEGIRWLTTIVKENKDLVKVFMNAGVQVRHIGILPPINFAVDNTYFYATIDKMEAGKIMQSLLTSNESTYVNYYSSLFEGLWNNGIDAETRIRDIEEGIDSANIEMIQNSHEAIERAWNLIRTAKEEALIMYSTPNGFRRQLQMGTLQLFKDAIQEHPNVKIKLLIPNDEQMTATIGRAKMESPEGVMTDMKRQIVNDKVKLFSYKPNEEVIVEGDKERIIQVISNLLNNAIKFTEEGTISISTEVKGNNKREVFVTIKVTGQGIHPEIESRLFSKFASKSFQGTGLGLFISKSIVEAHGGKIWAENNSENKGATFTFSLPVSQYI